jgi:uncharacterized integral membrane protein
MQQDNMEPDKIDGGVKSVEELVNEKQNAEVAGSIGDSLSKEAFAIASPVVLKASVTAPVEPTILPENVSLPVVAPIPPLPTGTLPPRTEIESAAITPLPAPIIKPEKEVVKKHRIIWGDIFSCWVLGVGFLLIFLVLALFVLAKSGVVNVPYLSNWLYHPPVPPYFVVAKSLSWSDFNKTVSGKLAEQGLDTEPPLILQISEQVFTGLLQGVVENGLRSNKYKAEVAQVIFLPASIQLYFYLTWNDFFTFEILIHLVPVVENGGRLHLEVVAGFLGDQAHRLFLCP